MTGLIEQLLATTACDPDFGRSGFGGCPARRPIESTEVLVVSSDAHVMSYLRERAQPSDGVVVGFGHADIVAGRWRQSPYEQLWSLPVRVRDARLEELQGVLTGPSAPRWLVVAGDSLDTWGLDADRAQQYLERHYVEQVSYGDWHIWRRDGQEEATR